MPKREKFTGMADALEPCPDCGSMKHKSCDSNPREQEKMTNRPTLRQKAARKAAKTRAVNRASLKRWEEVDKPARLQEAALINKMLESVVVRVRFREREGGPTLRKISGGMGTLVKVLGTGLSWRVKIDGYKGKPQDWHAGFWEIVEEKR